MDPILIESYIMALQKSNNQVCENQQALDSRLRLIEDRLKRLETDGP